MKTSTKLTLLGTLYFSQGLPFGFFTQALPAWLREQGVSLAAIGLTSLLALPWALKFIWAPAVDRFQPLRALGRRRGWIIPLQIAAVVALLTLAVAPHDEVSVAILGGIFIVNLLAATQDIATDGLAVDVLSWSERGLGNGLQVAGYRVGMIVGGSALLVAFDLLGWAGTFVAMAGLLMAASIPIVFYHEPRTAPPPDPSVGRATSRLGSAPPEPGTAADDAPNTTRPSGLISLLRKPGMGLWFAVLLVYKTGDALAQGMLRPFMIDQGMSLSTLGWLVGGVGFTAGLLGALLGGWGVQWLGRKPALIAFGLLQAASIALYILPASGAPFATLIAACALEHLAGGMATAALFTWMMDLCDPATGSTDYTVQASVVVIATGVATVLSGVMAEALGYALHFGVSAIIAALGVALVLALKPPASAPSDADAIAAT